MKTTFTLLAIVMATFCFAQVTNIPDPNFEQALVDLGFDSDGVVNGQILTSDALDVIDLDVSGYNITNLTGIEDFLSLDFLYVNDNNLTTLDFSSNINLHELEATLNPLQSLNISQNTNLELLYLGNPLLEPGAPVTSLNVLDLSGTPNILELDCAVCPNLTSIDVSGLQNLEYLNVAYSDLSVLDVSNNTALIGIAIGYPENPTGSNPNLQSLDLSNNPNMEQAILAGSALTSLNVKNGNNTILYVNSLNVPTLYCIQVDDEIAANNGETPYDIWEVDPAITYSENCVLSVEDMEMLVVSLFPNPAGSILNFRFNGNVVETAILDIQGRKIQTLPINSSAINIETLPSGIYFLSVITESGKLTEKFIKI